MSARHLRGTVDRENGAILPLVTILILVMFGFAALGVDASAAYAERRQAQSAADAGALAGALLYLDPDAPSSLDVANAVIFFANANAPGTPPTAEDWLNCSDDAAELNGYDPLKDGSDIISPCITLKQTGEAPALLRVRMPNWDMPTSFAGLMGFETVAISATATAEIRYQADKPTLPFSLPAEPGTEECLATPPSGLLPGDEAPCGGSSQGNFGMIDSPWFGADSPQFTNSQPCPNDPNFNSRTPHNLALGLDHLISTWPEPPAPPAIGTWLPNNHPGADSCANAQTDTVPYVLNTQTGNTQTAAGKALLQDGMLGDDPSITQASVPGRLRQESPPNRPFDPGPPTVPGWSRPPEFRLNINTNNWNITVDNIGLWDYLDPSNSGACASSNFTGTTNVGQIATKNMVSCLEDGSPLFTLDLLKSPRFALVPVLNYNAGSQFGNKWWAVTDIRPVYLQTTWYNCTKGGNKDCLFQPDNLTSVPSDRDTYSILFKPGEGSEGPCYISGGACVAPLTSRFQLMGLSALILDWSQFPPDSENQFGSQVPFEVFLYPNE